MATYAALGHTTWIGPYDMTGDSSSLTLNTSTDPQVCTPFGSTAVKRVAGLRDVESTVEGYWELSDNGVDERSFDNLGDLQVVTHTVSGTELDRAYFYQAKSYSYEFGGQVGEVAPFTLQAQGARGNASLSVGAIGGRLLKAKGNISGTGATGSVYQLGAVSATQYLYAAVHCFSVGTTFTLQIQSDNASNFPSATTRMTIGPITTTGGTWGTRVAGAITDDYWRVNVSAVTGTSQIAVVVGIK